MSLNYDAFLRILLKTGAFLRILLKTGEPGTAITGSHDFVMSLIHKNKPYYLYTV